MSLPQIPFEAFRDRAERSRELMRFYGIDVMLLTPSVNLRYLSGCGVDGCQGFTCLLHRLEAGSQMIAPVFERGRILASGLPLEMHAWDDSSDPMAIVRKLLGLRPGLTIGVDPMTPYGTYLELVRAVPEARWIDGTPLLQQLRLEKSPEEIDCLRAAVRVTEGAFARIPSLVRPGITERELAGILVAEQAALGGEGSTALVQFGEDSTIPYGAPGGRKLCEGDLILVDMGTTVCGYHSDLARAYAYRSASKLMREVYEIVRESQAAVRMEVRHGARVRDLVAAARGVVQRHEYTPYFPHRIGHGIGLEWHEIPDLQPESDLALRSGMVLSLEPAIYLPGRLGVRLEDTFLVTADGYRALSEPPGELPVIG